MLPTQRLFHVLHVKAAALHTHTACVTTALFSSLHPSDIIYLLVTVCPLRGLHSAWHVVSLSNICRGNSLLSRLSSLHSLICSLHSSKAEPAAALNTSGPPSFPGLARAVSSVQMPLYPSPPLHRFFTGLTPSHHSRPSSDISSPEKKPSLTLQTGWVPGSLCSHRPCTSCYVSILWWLCSSLFLLQHSELLEQRNSLFPVCPALGMFSSQNMSAEWINVMIPRCPWWVLIKPLEEETEMPLVWALRELCSPCPQAFSAMLRDLGCSPTLGNLELSLCIPQCGEQVQLDSCLCAQAVLQVLRFILHGWEGWH